MTVEYALMVLLLGITVAMGGRPWSRIGLSIAGSLMAVGYSRRTLAELRRLEQERSEPDALMISLFDVSLGVSTLGLLAVIAALPA